MKTFIKILLLVVKGEIDFTPKVLTSSVIVTNLAVANTILDLIFTVFKMNFATFTTMTHNGHLERQYLAKYLFKVSLLYILQHLRDGVEIKPIISLAVSLGKVRNGIASTF